MAGSLKSDSRLSITLQGLDQVIALSQANINESLEYHFSTRPDLCKFRAAMQGSADLMKGTLKPPTIQLVDVDGADQALYCLEFEEGKLIQYITQATKETPDSDDEGGPPVFDKIITPIEGWKLVFYVDFSMKKMAQVPESISKQVQLPGSYSVEQLIVNFGTAEMMTLASEHCVLKGFPSKLAESTARSTLGIFVNKWITSLTAVNNTGSHNVLGYAIKADTPASLPPSNPSFPPTSVRLQTINYRPGGDASKSRPDHDHNAFLFTEMTGFRDMVTKDLMWSGDWFYDSIGGTLVMSKRIFWDEFLTKKLKVISERAIEGVRNIVEAMATPLLESKIEFPSVNADWKPYPDGPGAIFEWSGMEKTISYEKEMEGPNSLFNFVYRPNVRCLAIPVVGEPRVLLKTQIDVMGSLKVEAWGIPKAFFEVFINSYAPAVSDSYIEFQQVAESGAIVVDVKKEEVQTECKVEAKLEGVTKYVPELNQLLLEQMKPSFWTDRAREAVLSAVASAADIKKDLADALNGQRAFVFPGGGSFQMKDPIFNKAGDLMVGLTYKSGNAV